MARIFPALLLAQYGVTISTFDSHASILQSSSDHCVARTILSFIAALAIGRDRSFCFSLLDELRLRRIYNSHLPLSELRFFPNDCLAFLLLLKCSCSPVSLSACNSASLGPPSGKSCSPVSRLFLRVLVRCPGSLEPYPGFISKSPYILFISALFSSMKRSIRSLKSSRPR